MSTSSFRVGTKRFIDREKFPHGFDRAGDFTVPEADLLTQYGDTMRALEAGELEPENSEEKHFIKVINNPKKANSKLERVWLKYIQLARGGKRFHSLNSKKPAAVSDVEVDDEDDDLLIDDMD